MENLTDIELYNCPKISRIPDFYYNLPKLQAMNLARQEKAAHEIELLLSLSNLKTTMNN